jgi:exopolysaccharide production protein ExoQ
MSPTLALIVWLILLLVLLRLDPARQPDVSLALWVPVVWIFVVATRLPSQWFAGQLSLASGSLEEGNPLDRTIFVILILLSIGILISRSFRWSVLVSRNLALMAFLLFALLSVLWSDFPFVAFKRWFRDLGNYLVILVVLSDPRPLDAVRTVLRRLGYVLIPLSILLIKYFPAIGVEYWMWTGQVMFRGPTTGKNLLGAICLVSGLFYFWDTVDRWSDIKEKRTKRIIVVNIIFMIMTLWLLILVRSSTSTVCLLIGCMVVLAARSKWAVRHPSFLKLIIPASFCLYLILAFGLDLQGEFTRMVGRDPTLTERTEIWKGVLSLHTNPLIGTGYESFWLGPRLDWLWKQKAIHGINEAHDGYLEVYLNLGLIGLALLGVFLIASYRTVCKKLATQPSFASFALAMWAIVLFYNVTEAAFKFHWMWVTFLFGAIDVPEHSIRETNVASTLERGTTEFNSRRLTKRLSDAPATAKELQVPVRTGGWRTKTR